MPTDKHATIRRLTPLMILVVIAFMIVWADPSVSTEPNKSEPTLRELIEGKVKDERATKPGDPDTEELGAPNDPLSRDTPRSTVREFLAAAKNRDYTRAAEYLDLRNLPREMTSVRGEELARRLKIVLDRVLWIDTDLLSTSLEGDRSDNLPMARDRIGRIATEGGKTYDILLQRVPRGDGVYIWKFAGVTVADIPELYAKFGYGPLEEVLPLWLFDITVLGIHIWVWIVITTLGLVLYPVAMLITRAAIYSLRRFHPELAETIARLFSGPVTLLLWTVLMRIVGHAVVQTSVVGQAIEGSHTVQIMALALILLRLVDLGFDRVGRNLDQKGLGGARVLLRPAAGLVKIFALAGTLLLWLDNIGYRVTTLLAGLSISGVAVALAAQKSIENIFGAITLYTARPVKVGDFCRFGDAMGTVEEIGLRATRIRTLERSVISIANAEFAGMHLDNLSARDRFWYHPLLQLRYETTSDQLRYILIEVRKMLYAHPKVIGEPLHVRFQGFGEYSLNVEVFSCIGVTDYTESLGIAEDLNFRIMDIVTESGSALALPAGIEYQLQGRTLDEDRSRAIAAQVKEWKARRALYLPNFPKDKIAEVKGSLDYPPEGSPQYNSTSA